MAYDPNPVRMYDSMNDSVRRANAFHDRRVQSLADFEDAERAGSLEDASLARQLARDRVAALMAPVPPMKTFRAV